MNLYELNVSLYVLCESIHGVALGHTHRKNDGSSCVKNEKMWERSSSLGFFHILTHLCSCCVKWAWLCWLSVSESYKNDLMQLSLIMPSERGCHNPTIQQASYLKSTEALMYTVLRSQMKLGNTLTQIHQNMVPLLPVKSVSVSHLVFHLQTHAGMAHANNDPLTLIQTLRKCMCFLYFRVSDKPVWSVPK